MPRGGMAGASQVDGNLESQYNMSSVTFENESKVDQAARRAVTTDKFGKR